jgi:hypothetical protein
VKSPVAKNGVVKQIDGRHGNCDIVLCAGLLELTNNSISLGLLGVDRDQVVVVQVHTPGAGFS